MKATDMFVRNKIGKGEYIHRQLWESQAWPLEEIDTTPVPSNSKNGRVFHGFGEYG